jgi:hypothetical protein
LEWRRSEGHEWSATPLQVKKGHWCPFCARVARLTLPLLQRIADRKRGRCLAVRYVNSSQSVRWRCAAGHEWLASAHSIRTGHWCPVCAHNQRLRLEEMSQIARERGGRCLSTSYKNGTTPLRWVCRQGHRWIARPANVKAGSRRKGSWCPRCYNGRRKFHARLSIAAMKGLAKAREGMCLSTQYFGSKFRLRWRCNFGHRWEATPASVVQGSWCPICAHNQRLTLELFQALAANRGGSCLSKSYLNERIYLRWRCREGHTWKAAPAKVKLGSWCPRCAVLRRRSKWILRRVVTHDELRR